jgi:two-component system KDP operon response regulator KdpE
MGALTVLVIDIDESLQSAVLALRDAGFQVIEALESGEGVKRTLDYSPSIIVINEDMPPINGVELVSVLRNLTESPIITLGSGGEMALVQTLLQGADLYLTRPVNGREFMARVRSLLRRYVAPRGVGGEPLLQC